MTLILGDYGYDPRKERSQSYGGENKKGSMPISFFGQTRGSQELALFSTQQYCREKQNGEGVDQGKKGKKKIGKRQIAAR